MSLSREQTKSLVGYVASAREDEIDCDACFELLAEFVELELEGKEIPEAMRCVQRHLEQCACCNDEHKALLEALGELG